MNYLLVPTSSLSLGDDISYSLGEMDIFINLIRENLGVEKYLILKKYNNDLYEIVNRYYFLMESYYRSNLYQYGNLYEKNLIITIFNHIATISYLSLDKMDYNYDLMSEVCNKIMNNYTDFLMVCEIEKINCCDVINDETLLKEYRLCGYYIYDEIKRKKKLR